MKDNLYIEPQIINISEKEAVQALYNAFIKKYKCKPSNNALAILYAKTALETGRFKKGFYNYNFGNIKKQKDQKWTMFKCSEIINGKEIWFEPPHFQTHFSAYESLKEGALAYINFVSGKQRYFNAWKALLNGNPENYVHELKVAGYFTASEDLYLKAVLSLFNEFLRRIDELLEIKNEQSNNFIKNNKEYIEYIALQTIKY
jgi:hypothetical protein